MQETKQGMVTTKFQKGFQRRRQEDIPPDHEVMAYQEERAGKVAVQAGRRRERLRDADHYNNFNVITHAKTQRSENALGPPRLADMRPEGIGRGDRQRDMHTTPEHENESQILLRDSHYRFFAPQTTGQNLAKRREIHASEGMHKPRMSSVLGVGRSEMASYGVSDQFERSSYGDPNYRPPTGFNTGSRRQQMQDREDIAAVRSLV